MQIKASKAILNPKKAKYEFCISRLSITSPMASSRLKNISRQEKILSIRSIGFKSLVLPFSQLKQVLRKSYFIFISEVFNEESSSVSYVSVRSESSSGCYRELRRQECPTRREQSDFSLFCFYCLRHDYRGPQPADPSLLDFL